MTWYEHINALTNGILIIQYESDCLCIAPMRPRPITIQLYYYFRLWFEATGADTLNSLNLVALHLPEKNLSGEQTVKHRNLHRFRVRSIAIVYWVVDVCALCAIQLSVVSVFCEALISMNFVKYYACSETTRINLKPTIPNKETKTDK